MWGVALGTLTERLRELGGSSYRDTHIHLAPQGAGVGVSGGLLDPQMHSRCVWKRDKQWTKLVIFSE